MVDASWLNSGQWLPFAATVLLFPDLVAFLNYTTWLGFSLVIGAFLVYAFMYVHTYICVCLHIYTHICIYCCLILPCYCFCLTGLSWYARLWFVHDSDFGLFMNMLFDKHLVFTLLLSFVGPVCCVEANLTLLWSTLMLVWSCSFVQFPYLFVVWPWVCMSCYTLISWLHEPCCFMTCVAYLGWLHYVYVFCLIHDVSCTCLGFVLMLSLVLEI